MSFLPSMANANLLDVFRHWPEFARVWQAYIQQVMRVPSPLSEGERELIAAYVSRLNGCEYCEGSHTRVAAHFGFGSELVAEIDRDIGSSSLADRHKPLFRFVKKLTETPKNIEQADVDEVLAAGWDETALFHATNACAAFNAMNRVVDGLGIEADEHMAELGAKMLYEKGYTGIPQEAPAR